MNAALAEIGGCPSWSISWSKGLRSVDQFDQQEAVRRVGQPRNVSGCQRALRTSPNMGAGLMRVARSSGDFGDAGYACVWPASLTETGSGHDAIADDMTAGLRD